LDNAFVHLNDREAAQKLAEAIRPDRLHKRLDEVVKTYCPIVRHFSSGYHWSSADSTSLMATTSTSSKQSSAANSRSAVSEMPTSKPTVPTKHQARYPALLQVLPRDSPTPHHRNCSQTP
jgi:hypothetical protein